MIHVNRLKNVAKKALFSSRLYRLNRLQNQCHILPYHMIADEPNGFYPEDSSRLFARQIAHLAANYNVITLEEIAHRISIGKSIRGCAAVTFDDGFRDNYQKAYPILRRYGIPATIFLATEYIETGEPPWFIQFRTLFLHTPKTRIEIELGGERVPLPLSSPADKRSSGDRVMRHLQSCPNDERLSILKELPSILHVLPGEGLRSLMLTWDQIREMGSNGIDFGAHTVTHPILSNIGPEQLRSEIAESKAQIEEKTGREVKTFAYPFGRKRHYPGIAPSILRDLGFSCAATTEYGPNPPGAPVYELNRSRPWELELL